MTHGQKINPKSIRNKFMISQTYKISAVSLAFLLTALPIFAQTSYSGVVAFGDSLSDAGNIQLSTNTQSQSGQGIGGTWVMQLAAKLGYTMTPSNSGGTDFARGGSTTSELPSQISSYLSTTGGSASPTALYTVLSAANDLFGANSSNVDTVANTAADNDKAAIIMLINAGAKTIIWPNMISGGLSPSLQGNTVAAEAIREFNVKWAIDVAALQSAYPGVRLIALDEYKQWQLLAANPSAYNITYTTQGFTTAPASVPHSAASSNPDADYFSSWDGGHPTTYIHSFTAANAYQALMGGLTDGTYQVANVNSGLNLDTVGEASTDGVAVDQATANANAVSQKWNLVSYGGANQYLLMNAENGRALDVYGGSTSSGATVDIWDSNGASNQRWTITANSSGKYIITGVQSGNVLEVYGFSTSSGGTVDMWSPNGGTNQQWQLTAIPVPAQPPVSNVVAFGDSLSDAGNVQLSTNTQSQSGQGIGGTWVMQLAAKLGYTMTPSNSGGTDFAAGGSTTSALSSQVSSYLSTTGGSASPTALYTILSGANDLFGANSSNVDTVANTAADNVKAAIITLINAGAKNIMWPSMPSLQLSPNFQSNSVDVHGFKEFNAEWAIDVAALRSTYPGIHLVTFDEDKQWQMLAANPSAYNIMYTTQGFTTAPASVPYSAASSNPDADYFSSWDGGHPTTYIHSFTAANAYQALIGGLTDGSYQIANVNSGLNLDTVGEGTSDGVDVDQALNSNANAVSQKWDLVSYGGANQYLAINEASGRALDVYGGSTSSGATVDIWDSNGASNQRWTITANSSGNYTIQGLQSGNFLDVASASTSSGALVNVSTSTGAASQQWQLTATINTLTAATSYDSASGGVGTENSSEGSTDVGWIQNGAYTVYNNINLTGDVTFVARVASAGSGGNINVCLDSPTGTVIGTVAVPVTGGWQNWTTVSCNITATTGIHNLYLVYTGGSGYLFNIEWFAFPLPNLGGTEAASYNSASGGVGTENSSEGGTDVGWIQNGAYTAYNNINLTGDVTFVARVATAGSGGNINVCLDSPTGTVIGTATVPVTGGWQTWATVACNITATTGTHNLYLVYTGGSGNLFNIEWFALFP